MTKEEILKKIRDIDAEIDNLQADKDRLIHELYLLNKNNPPPLGVSVQDGIGAEDKFGGA